MYVVHETFKIFWLYEKKKKSVSKINQHFNTNSFFAVLRILNIKNNKNLNHQSSYSSWKLYAYTFEKHVSIVGIYMYTHMNIWNLSHDSLNWWCLEKKLKSKVRKHDWKYETRDAILF